MREITLILSFYGCALYGFVNPLFGVLFFVSITIFRPTNLLWGNQWLGRLHLSTAVLVLAGYLYRRLSIKEWGNVGPFQSTNLLLFFAFLMWLMIVSVLAEYSPSDSFRKTFEVAKVFVFCFLFSRLITTRKSLDQYVTTSVGALSLLSFWGIEQGLRGNERLDTLTVGGSNFLAAQIVLLIPLSLVKIFDDALPKKSRLYYSACTPALLVCLFYSGSRGGLVGLAAAIVCLISKVKHRFRIIAFSLLTVALVSPWMPSLFLDRIDTLFVTSEERDLSAKVRPVLWKIALRIWQDHPFAGVGLENFSPVKEKYANRVHDIVTSDEMYAHIFGQQRYTHGLYQGMLAETGIFGLALFLCLLVRNAFGRLPKMGEPHLHTTADLARATQSGLIGFSVSSVFGDFQFIELVYWQVFLVGAIRDLLSRDHGIGLDPSLILANGGAKNESAKNKLLIGQS